MRLSVNELESLARKAAVGAGLDHGHALEAARTLVWLCAAGIPCLPAFAAALDARSRDSTAPVQPVTQHSTLVLRTADERPACPLYAGPALRDFARLSARQRGFDRIEIIDVSHTCFVLARLAMDPDIGELHVQCRESASAAPRWDALMPGAEVAGDILDHRAAHITLARAPAGAVQAGDRRRKLAADMAGLFERGVAVESAALESLKSFYNLTLVPDSHASRQHGAGAGLVDSD